MLGGNRVVLCSPGRRPFGGDATLIPAFCSFRNAMRSRRATVVRGRPLACPISACVKPSNSTWLRSDTSSAVNPARESIAPISAAVLTSGGDDVSVCCSVAAALSRSILGLCIGLHVDCPLVSHPPDSQIGSHAMSAAGRVRLGCASSLSVRAACALP